MNKFVAIFALAMVAACAVSANPITGDDDVASELALSPSDSEEVAGLEGQTIVFSDFCINYRDYVVGDIRTSSNSMAANLFKMFFNAAEEVGLDAINTERNAAARLGYFIKDPSASVPYYDERDPIDGPIGEGETKIHGNSNQAQNLLQGIMSAFSATKNAITYSVVHKLYLLKAALSQATLIDSLNEACDRIKTYDQELVSRFEATRTALGAHEASYLNVKLENVDCVTVRRIIRLDGVCNFAKSVKDPLMKVIALKQ